MITSRALLNDCLATAPLVCVAVGVVGGVPAMGSAALGVLAALVWLAASERASRSVLAAASGGSRDDRFITTLGFVLTHAAVLPVTGGLLWFAGAVPVLAGLSVLMVGLTVRATVQLLRAGVRPAVATAALSESSC